MKSEPSEIISFGPFHLAPTERRLERAGIGVSIGGRALDLLIALVERAGDTVSKKDLIARVWPDVTVDEGSLRFHVAVLRKALGDGDNGVRYVTNAPGRGYCFTAPLTRSRASRATAIGDGGPASSRNLPPRLKRMVGRDQIVRAIADRLVADRFVTIVGHAGIGKTTVAVSVSHALLADFEGSVCFVDFSILNDPGLVVSALASALGAPLHSDDPVLSLIKFIRDKRILVILDSCEHVIDAVSAVAERIFQEAPLAFILATSREPMRVEGETLQTLFPLDYPPDDKRLTAIEALSFPAVQLFVERVAASISDFALSDREAPVVGEICRKLDGIALAIELAAGRVHTYGVSEIAALLSSRIELLWQGRRTAPPRHQTLKAALDWSYNLLPELESLVLRRLAVFMGSFSLDAAQSIAAGERIGKFEVVESIGDLVAKSLLTIDTTGALPRFRLLDVTRTYLTEKLHESGESDVIARRHALYYQQFLERIGVQSADSANVGGVAAYAEHIGNVRAALQWSFSKTGDTAIGIAIAVGSGPLLMAVSPMAECRHWTKRAISALDDATRGTLLELELQESLGLSLMFNKEGRDEVRPALTRSLVIAEHFADSQRQLRIINALNSFLVMLGLDLPGALAFARRGEAIAKSIGDPESARRANSMLGITLHHMGDQKTAQIYLEAALARASPAQLINMARADYSTRNQDRCTLARILWLRGKTDQGLAVARQTIDEAEALGHPIIFCVLIIFLLPVFFWTGDYVAAGKYIEKLLIYSEKHDLVSYHSVALGFKGEWLIYHGEHEVGIPLVRNYLEKLTESENDPQAAAFSCTLARGLYRAGSRDEPLRIIELAITKLERHGNHLYLPELLRTKADLLGSSPRSSQLERERLLRRSLELAVDQSALAWELRAATSLATLLYEQERYSDSRTVLAPVYARFTEGLNTIDLMTAAALLQKSHGA